MKKEKPMFFAENVKELGLRFEWLHTVFGEKVVTFEEHTTQLIQ